jgi:hypothetical protein
MLFYRWIKRNAFMNRDVSKYVWYAFGEILLVIVGIIIALQIDAWHENNQKQERLDDYLETIAQNISGDIQRLQQLRSVRAETIFSSFSTFLATLDSEAGDTDWFNAALTSSARVALEKAQKKLYFVADSGSYRALESSGLVSELRSTEIESMLYDYYRTVDRIANIEQDLNNVIGDLTLRFQTETARELPQIILREPLILWQTDASDDQEANEVLRQRYWKLLTDSVTHSILRSTMNQPVMKEYEHLLSTGQQLIMKIHEELDYPTASQAFMDIPVTGSSIGHPFLIKDGRPGYHSYGVFTAPLARGDYNDFDHVYNNIWIDDNALNVRYTGGQPWAYLYVKYGRIDILFERFSADYSSYDRLRLELKRDVNTQCSDLHLEIKDIDDAEKGDLRSVPLALTPEWQIYMVNLDEFVEADLTRLNVVAGFLLASPQPCSFSIREVRYLKPESEALSEPSS